jgi:hypothetical protein
MDHIGIDVHKKDSQICILTEQGELLERLSAATPSWSSSAAPSSLPARGTVRWVGEAGVGKSRLTYEFTHSHRVHNWLILEASSVSYGKAMSYLPVIDLLRGYFQIDDRDDHGEMRNKMLGRVLGLDRALEPMLPPLLALLDVPFEDTRPGRT